MKDDVDVDVVVVMVRCDVVLPTFGGSVGAVGSAEGVVHEQVGVLRELGGEGRHVLLLFGIETDVLQQAHITVFHLGDGFAHRHTDAVGNQRHGLAQQLGETASDGGQREFGLVATLGTAQVR